MRFICSTLYWKQVTDKTGIMRFMDDESCPLYFPFSSEVNRPVTWAQHQAVPIGSLTETANENRGREGRGKRNRVLCLNKHRRNTFKVTFRQIKKRREGEWGGDTEEMGEGTLNPEISTQIGWLSTENLSVPLFVLAQCCLLKHWGPTTWNYNIMVPK